MGRTDSLETLIGKQPRTIAEARVIYGLTDDEVEELNAARSCNPNTSPDDRASQIAANAGFIGIQVSILRGEDETTTGMGMMERDFEDHHMTE
jgi:hypothetical protein